jgi:hypothetical protein
MSFLTAEDAPTLPKEANDALEEMNETIIGIKKTAIENLRKRELSEVNLGNLNGVLLIRDKIKDIQNSFSGDIIKENVVNLLKLADIDRDAIHGEWSLDKRGIKCLPDRCAKLSFPYSWYSDYELTASFTKISGDDDINIIFA